MKSSQNARLLAALKAGQVIDPLKSWQTLGIYRLAARIHDLINEGHSINK
ncbi:MAG: helix-turn-helix domain-containing protein, partial [Desulfobulbia bacterium]